MTRQALGVVRAAGAVSLLAAVAAALAPAPAHAVRAEQELVELLRSHTARSAPSARAATLRTLAVSRPLTGVRTTLPLLARARRNGVRWVQVRLPGRPNGAKGWIRREGTRLTRTSWHLEVRTSSRRVVVHRRGRRAASFAAVVGKLSTPTPHGRFFVEESVIMPAGSAGAPFALALSARSNVLQEFGGGPGQVALHGVANLGGTPGTAVSHGCVRLRNADIAWLASRIAPGTPVTIGS